MTQQIYQAGDIVMTRRGEQVTLEGRFGDYSGPCPLEYRQQDGRVRTVTLSGRYYSDQLAPEDVVKLLERKAVRPTKMNIVRLYLLANFLKGLPAEKFRFNYVVRRYEDAPDAEDAPGTTPCGSVCCAIGWTPRLFPKEVRWTGSWGTTHPLVLTGSPDNRPSLFTDVASKLFGLTYEEVSVLFQPGYSDLGFEALPGSATPQQVAERIVEFVETKVGLRPARQSVQLESEAAR